MTLIDCWIAACCQNYHSNLPTDFALKVNKRKQKSYEMEKQNPSRYTITQRPHLIGYQIQRMNPSFDQRLPPRPLTAACRPITIQYGHPVSTKKLKKSHAKTDDKREVIQNAENLRSFNQRIVVVKGKLKKPITNFRRKTFLPNFHTITL